MERLDLQYVFVYLNLLGLLIYSWVNVPESRDSTPFLTYFPLEELTRI